MFNLFWKQFLITKDFKLVLIFVIVLGIYWFKNKIFRKLVLKIIGRTPTTIDDEWFPIVNAFVNVIIFSVAIINFLIYFGIDMKSMITTAGVGSLAIAFAIKDTLIDIMSGFMLMIDKPFKVNDNIRLSSGEDVIVLDIGLRKSRFLYNITFKDSEIKNKDCVLIMSNSDLIKNKVYNYTEAEKKEWEPKYKELENDLNAELRDPNGTIWEHAK